MRLPLHTPAPRPLPSRHKGFTLVELSIVILVLSLLMAGVVSFYNAKLEQDKLDETIRKLDIIENAILTFRRAYDSLPCPAPEASLITTAAFGSAVAAGCASSTSLGGGSNGAIGVLPIKNLQLSNDMMFDGWGNRFTYAVDTRATTGALTATYPITGATLGSLTVRDAGGNTRTSNAVYVVVSHGRNGHGAYSRSGTRLSSGSTNTDEQNNCNCNSSAAAGTIDAVFVQRLTTENTTLTNRFDDIVRYKTRWQLYAITTAEFPPVSTY